MSRKKQPIPHDPITEAKKKMLAAKLERMKAAAPVSPPNPVPPTPPTPSVLDSEWEKLRWVEGEEDEAPTPDDRAWGEELQRQMKQARDKKKAAALAYHPTRLPPLEELMPDIASKTFRIPPTYNPTYTPPLSTANMVWSTPYLAAEAIKVTVPIPAGYTPVTLPLMLVRTDRPSTPKDALGPAPGIVRQVVLGTAAWPKHIEIEMETLKQFDPRVVRFIHDVTSSDKLYFWLANGCAIYDAAVNLDGTRLAGTLIHGAVSPYINPDTGLPIPFYTPTPTEEE
jgi:hypothetical protein